MNKYEIKRSALKPPLDISIRQMVVEDLDQVSQLEAKVFANPWSRQDLAHEIIENRNSYALVAVHKTGIAGHAIGWCLDDEAEIGTFAVEVSYRRNKIGSCLLSTLLEYFNSKNVDHVYLEVRRSNLAAQNVYLSQGFEVSGVRRRYYREGNEDALLMKLCLKEGK